MASQRAWLVVSLLVILAVPVAIRIRLLDFPLERDEGEYAYAGQLLLQGVPPYQHVYSMKWPGTSAAYALIMVVFGQTSAGIHAGLILINLATAILVFLLTRRICGDWAGVVAAGTYGLLSISPPTLGLAAHATHFVMLPALAGVFLLQTLDDRTSAGRIFLAGLLLGIAVLMKQSGAAFGLFAASWIVWFELSQKSRGWRRLATRLGCLALGGLLPFLSMCSALALAGEFDRFWRWTFQYARAYALVLPLAERTGYLSATVGLLFRIDPGLWCLAVLGLVLLFCERSLGRWRFFVLGFAFFSFLAVCPGGRFRNQYFLQLLPVAGLLAGVAISVASGLFARLPLSLPPALIPSVFFAAAALWSFVESGDIFFLYTPVQACRAVYRENPFPESVEIGRYLAAHCPTDARIAVIGSEPQIYFYSHRRSATGYVYTYSLMEPQPYAAEMQKEMIREIENSDPDYMVYVNIPTSWLSGPDSGGLIFDWFGQYQEERFQLVGLVKILSADRTEYQWLNPQEPVSIPPRSAYWLAIFKNRHSSGNTPSRKKTVALAGEKP